MRIKLKFQKFKQLKNWKILNYIPLKILNSKKKIWKAKAISIDKQYKSSILKNNTVSLNIISPTKKWEFNSKNYKIGLDLKRYFYHLFDNGIRNKILKNYFLNLTKKYNQNIFINFSIFLLKPNYQLDILLSTIGFFKSIYESRKYILNKRIKLNEKFNSNPRYQVKLGDIITFNDYNIKILKNNLKKKNLILNKQFFTFCEIDFYNKNLIIISDFLENIHSYENPQLFFKKFDIKKFITYLKREY